MMHIILVFTALAGCAVQQAQALVTKGSVVLPARKAVFFTKFCVDYDANGAVVGDFRLRIIDAQPKTGDLELVLFDDQADSYPNENAMWEFQCGSQRLKTAAKFERSIDVTALPNSGRYSVPLVERLRPRWWFVAAIDCSGVERTLEYSLHMTNPRKGWQKEFSMDHCGLISLIFIFAAYFALALVQGYAIHQRNESAKHPLRLFLFAAIVVACWSSVALVLDGVSFARHGENQTALYLAGKFFKVFSKCLLVSILMLLSQGICISRQLCAQNLWQVSRLVTPFFAACLILELWGEHAQSRNYTTGFIYDSWFGCALIFADLCLLALYLKNLHRSYLSESDLDRQQLYCFWGLLYSCAFIVLPFATWLAFVLSPWVRAETIFLVTNGVHASMLASLVLGLWPERAHKFFCIDNPELAKTIGTKTDALADLNPSALLNIHALP